MMTMTTIKIVSKNKNKKILENVGKIHTCFVVYLET